MRKEEKNAIIVKLKDYLNEYQHFYITDISGLNAEQTSDLRRECFKNDIKMTVVKNTLLHKAFEASELDFEPLYDTLKGNIALMFSQTANVPAKLLKEYKDKKKEIPALKAAYAEEGFFVGADKLDELCSIKSKNELIADVVAMLEAPMQGVLSALDSGANTIHGVLETLSKRAE